MKTLMKIMMMMKKSKKYCSKIYKTTTTELDEIKDSNQTESIKINDSNEIESSATIKMIMMMINNKSIENVNNDNDMIDEINERINIKQQQILKIFKNLSFKINRNLKKNFFTLSLSSLLLSLLMINFAFCLPQNINNHNNNNNNNNNEMKKLSDSLKNSYNYQQQQHYQQQQRKRLKRDVFIFEEPQQQKLNEDLNENTNNKIKRDLYRKNQATYENCPSKECFRKVANFERFLRLYGPKKFQITQFDCALRDIFFNCIKDETKNQNRKNKKCKKKRYDHSKKRIAKLLSETRLCIGL